MQPSGDEVCIAHTILPYSKGIICGESGAISFYEYDKAHKTYRRYRSVKVEETNARVCGLALSVAENMLMCLLSTNRLVHLSFEELEEMSADTISSNVHTQVSPKLLCMLIFLTFPKDCNRFMGYSIVIPQSRGPCSSDLHLTKFVYTWILALRCSGQQTQVLFQDSGQIARLSIAW